MKKSRLLAPTSLALCCSFAACDLPAVDVDVDSASDTDVADDGDDGDEGDDVAQSESGDPDHEPGCTTGGADDGESDAASDTPPELTITAPAEDATNDAGPMYDGYDDAMGLWYYDVTLTAEAIDAEDGDLSTSIVWSTDQEAIQQAELGTGAEVSVRLYSDDCFGTLHVITATVTDADGNTTDAMRLLNIWELC